MRLLAATLFLILACGFSLLASARNEVESPVVDDRTRIQGDWRTAGMECNGHQVSDQQTKQMRWSISERLIQITNSDGELEPRTTFEIDSSAVPKQIELTNLVGSHKDKVFPGIFMFDGNKLIICCAETPTSKRPTEFATSEGSSSITFTLERIEK